MHLRGADEVAEERVRARGPRSQLGVELPRDEERMVGQLDDLGEAPVVRVAREHEPGLLEPLVVGGVDLPAMTVTLVHDLLAVGGGGQRARHEVAGLRPQPHGPAEVGHVLLLGEQVDDRVRRRRVELARVGALEPQTLRANSITAHCSPRQMPRNGTPRSRAYRTAATLPSTPRTPNPPGMRTPSTSRERLLGRLPAEVVGGDPLDLHVGAVVEPAVVERLHHGQVGVAQVHVLADDRDRDRLGGGVDPIDERLPLGEVGLARRRRRCRASSSSRPSRCSTSGTS